MNDISFHRALLAGILSFISPCVLPLILPYAALLIALANAFTKDKLCYKRFLLISFTFLLGFLAVFVSTSAATPLGDLIMIYGSYLRGTGSGVIALLGIYTIIKTGIFIFSHKEGWLPYAGASVYPLALFFGMSIALGWTPCIGPTLGNILINASTQGTAISGTSMLITYAFGLGIPFLIIALATNAFLNLVKQNSVVMSALKVISGSCLVTIGYILATDSLRQLTKLFPDVVSY